MTVVAVVPVLAAWILDPIYNVMGAVLAFFYSVVPSYGLAIVLLTMTVRIFLIPLTTKQVRSQQAMQRIQPELKRLQAKYKNDRQKLNEEMMKFYKENKVNPVAGCLPILLQTPLFLVLYRLILGLNHQPLPKHLPKASALYISLSAAHGKMVSAGVDLARAASSVKGMGSALPYYLLIAITVGTGYYQQRQMTARLPKDAVNAQMQMIGKVFPVVFGFISFNLPAGVVVYFIVSNLWQIGQQAITFRKFPPPVTTGGAIAATSKDEGPRAPRDGKSPRNGSNGSGSGSGGGGRSGGSAKAGGNGNGRAIGKGSGKNGPVPPPSKGKRPPPSPRPKGLPAPGSKPGQKGTSAKNSRRKDT
ncbi:MAG: YidC/Oxa1 family membrane protein insertase [Actinomycetota bacterium]|nr:YidC/Oxa1 family membrane protein insertase [Actinomycetota bacterium]